MAAADASVSFIVSAANQIDLRVWQLQNTESGGGAGGGGQWGSDGQFILNS